MTILLTHIIFCQGVDKWLHPLFFMRCNHLSISLIRRLITPLLKLGHGWKIASHIFCGYNCLSMACSRCCLGYFVLDKNTFQLVVFEDKRYLKETYFNISKLFSGVYFNTSPSAIFPQNFGQSWFIWTSTGDVHIQSLTQGHIRLHMYIHMYTCVLLLNHVCKYDPVFQLVAIRLAPLQTYLHVND